MDSLNEKVYKIGKERNFNGNVLIAKDEKIIFNDGFGYSNIDKKTEFTKESVFRIGSITKQFTALCILQLVEKGLLRLNDSISSYLSCVNYDHEVTIHHLLSNSSGIPNFDIFGDYDDLLASNDFHKRMIEEVILKLPLNFKPGDKFEYSSSGFFILTYLIEKISKMPYNQYLEEYIIKPLDMKNTGFHFIDIDILNFVSLYDFKDNSIVEAIPYDMRKASGAGGMFSTIGDLYKWNRALIENKLISKKYMDLIFDIQTPINNNGGYGYGVINYRFDKEGVSHFVTYHPGNGPGVFAQNMIIDKRFQIIALSNVNDKNTFHLFFEDVENVVISELL